MAVDANLHRDLAYFLREGRILPFRGAAECAALAEWLGRVETAQVPASADAAALRELVNACARCGEVSDRKQAVGTGRNGVMVILNAPRLLERVERDVLKKEAVDLLKKIIQAAKLTVNDCYISNLIKCESADISLQPSRMMANCLEIVRQEIVAVAPRIVIVFGDIMPLQRIIKETRDTSWFNIDHPITMVKNPDLKKNAWNTLKLVMARLAELGII